MRRWSESSGFVISQFSRHFRQFLSWSEAPGDADHNSIETLSHPSSSLAPNAAANPPTLPPITASHGGVPTLIGKPSHDSHYIPTIRSNIIYTYVYIFIVSILPQCSAFQRTLQPRVLFYEVINGMWRLFGEVLELLESVEIDGEDAMKSKDASERFAVEYFCCFLGKVKSRWIEPCLPLESL